MAFRQYVQRSGLGLEQDFEQALFWYHKAAEQDDGYQLIIRHMYY